MDLLSHSIIFWSSWDFHDNQTGISTCWKHLTIYCRGSAIYNTQLQPALSLRSRCQGFPAATISTWSPGFFHRKIEPKEIPCCCIPHLLVVFTQQLDILVTSLTAAIVLDYKMYLRHWLLWLQPFTLNTIHRSLRLLSPASLIPSH